jgi:hypothetical protein
MTLCQKRNDKSYLLLMQVFFYLYHKIRVQFQCTFPLTLQFYVLLLTVGVTIFCITVLYHMFIVTSFKMIFESSFTAFFYCTNIDLRKPNDKICNVVSFIKRNPNTCILLVIVEQYTMQLTNLSYACPFV